MIHELFKQTMNRYGIRGKDLAPLAGISPNHLSEFRSGKTWISPEVFLGMLEGMEKLAPGSRQYFCELLNEKPLPEKTNIGEKLVALIEAADDDEMEQLLLSIGRKWKRDINKAKKETSNFTDKITDAIAV